MRIRDYARKLVRHCERRIDPGRGYRFAPELADRAFRFICSLRLTEGQWRGHHFLLQPWQAEFVGRLFGVVNDDGLRRYSRAYLWVARKNGKSQLISAISLYLLTAEGEPTPTVYIAAASSEQAGIIFRMAKDMVLQSPVLTSHCKAYQNQVLCDATGGRIKVLSARIASKHGLNVYCGIIDELHTQLTSDMWSVLETGTVARRQPIMFGISTAGDDPLSWGYSQYQMCRKVLDGELEEPSTLAVIYEAPQGCDLLDRDAWAAANPNLGITITEQTLERNARDALNSPDREIAFRQLHLNQWVYAVSSWVPIERWDACAVTRPPDVPYRHGRQAVYVGIDLGASHSLMAAARLHVPRDPSRYPFYAEFRLWGPERLLGELRRTSADIDRGVADGQITVCGQQVLDYDSVIEDLLRWLSRPKPDVIAVDPWRASLLGAKLEARGHNVAAVHQTPRDLMEPVRMLENLVQEGRLLHDGNPGARFCFGNITVKYDVHGNYRLARKNTDGPIDAISALANTLAVHVASEASGGTVYKQKKLVTADDVTRVVAPL